MQAIQFLLGTLASFFSGLFLLRFFMQLMRVSFSNPLGAFVVQLTHWAVAPLRRVIPGLFGLDLSSVLLAYLFQCLLYAVVLSLYGALLSSIPLYALLGLLRVCLYLFIILLFARAIFSWVNPWSPLAAPLKQLTQPILSPIQRILPPIANIDLSPLVMILLLQALLMLIP
ncbi:MAG: YggT family protein [Betaproteobacteria bacterium]|nr:YggT family protein [Betaproteobacteria bacterium]